MISLPVLSAIVVVTTLWAGEIRALTVEEVIKLKQAGVADSTIELLIQRSGDARSAGVWKQDGWIVYSTETRFPDGPRFDTYPADHPITVYPQVDSGRWDRRK
jgi:hypothetical protein